MYMMTSTHNVFTIQTNKECEEKIIQIETVITSGLYRFTLLGMQTKYASDTKDRVYSALRSSSLLNLKSDNRKIIVNLFPDTTDKKEGIYDLGIALSILSCIHTKLPDMQILALGGLSITGKITATKRIKQAIYTAHVHAISHIVCGEEDFSSIKKDDIKQLEHFGINIISANNLKDLVVKLRQLDTSVFVDAVSVESTLLTTSINKKGLGLPHNNCFDDLDSLNRALLFSLTGGHSLIIQTALTRHMKDMCENVAEMCFHKSFGHEIHAAFQHKLLDSEVVLDIMYIENIKNAKKEDVLLHQNTSKNSVLALYTPCSCGYQYSFFDSNTLDKRCICSKRSVLQHKRFIENTYFDRFTLHSLNTTVEPKICDGLQSMIECVRIYQLDRRVKEFQLSGKELYLFPDYSYTNQYRDVSKIKETLDLEANALSKEQTCTNNTLRLAQTIQDCMDVLGKHAIKKPAISKQALVLAISYIPRMDF